MSQFIKFYFTSSMLNMFRTLIHPSSRACAFSIVSPHWLCLLFSIVLEFRCLWLGWHTCGRLKHNFTSACLIHPSSGPVTFLLYHHIGCVFLFRCVLEFRCGWLEWYPCGSLKHNFSLLHGYHSNPVTSKPQHTSKQEYKPMWWYNRKVAGFWWCIY